MKIEPSPMSPVLLTVDQACAVGGFGRTHFYKLVHAGLIQPVKIGPKGVRVPTSEMTSLPDRLRDHPEPLDAA